MSKKQVAGYILDKRIGKGSYATVWRGRAESSDEAVAVKVISRQTVTETGQLRSEVEVLRRISHPNIVRFRDLKKSASHFYLVLEYCAGGDLSRFLKERGRVAEDPAGRLLAQIACGLCALHRENVLHRDLKPQNILLCDSSDAPALKIADFGFARGLQPQDMAATVCGSPLYMAPEILRHEPYDAKADLWSVGAILYELLMGRPPFSGANPMQLLANIEKQDCLSFDDVQVSAAGQEFLRLLLSRSPARRLDSLALARHPYVRHEAAPVPAEAGPDDGGAAAAAAAAPRAERAEPQRCPSPPATLEPAAAEARAFPDRGDGPRCGGGGRAPPAGGPRCDREAEEAPRSPHARPGRPDAGGRQSAGGPEDEYVVVAQQPISAGMRGRGPTPRAAASDFCGNLSRIARTLEQLSEERLEEECPGEGLALLLRALGLLERALNVSLLEEEVAEPLRRDFRRMLCASEVAAARVEASARLPAGMESQRPPARPNAVIFDFAVQQAREAAVVMSKGRELGGWEGACREKLSLALLLLDLLSSEADGEDLPIIASYTAPIARLVGEVDRLGKQSAAAGVGHA